MIFASFAKRSYERERIDDLDMTGDELEHNLRDLSLIFVFLGGQSILSGVKKLLKGYPQNGQPISIVDWGCGGGDNLRLIARWARKRNIKVKLVGVDANQTVINFARKHSKAYAEIEFEYGDCLAPEFQQRKYDITINSLFLHHFDDEHLEAMIPAMSRMSTIGVVCNDLQRHPLPYFLYKLWVWISRASNLTREDGLLSIKRSFVRKELKTLAEKSIEKSFELNWKWAFRYQLVIFS